MKLYYTIYDIAIKGLKLELNSAQLSDLNLIIMDKIFFAGVENLPIRIRQKQFGHYVYVRAFSVEFLPMILETILYYIKEKGLSG